MMGHSNVVKYLVLCVLAYHLITALTGCKADEEAKRAGQEVTRDSAGWARLRQQDALPPEKRDRGGAPTGPISSEW
jgi:hypothetical protein